MSDWGAVHSTGAANDGLDQFTGFCCAGDKPWFGPPAMKAALQSGAIPQARLAIVLSGSRPTDVAAAQADVLEEPELELEQR